MVLLYVSRLFSRPFVFDSTARFIIAALAWGIVLMVIGVRGRFPGLNHRDPEGKLDGDE
jgi:hypothetical protein